MDLQPILNTTATTVALITNMQRYNLSVIVNMQF